MTSPDANDCRRTRVGPGVSSRRRLLVGVFAALAAACSSPAGERAEATRPTLAEVEAPAPTAAGPAPCAVPPDPTDHGCLGRGMLRYDIGPRSGEIELVPRDEGATAFTTAYYQTVDDGTLVTVGVNDPEGPLRRLTMNWLVGAPPDVGWLTITALGPDGALVSWLAEPDDVGDLTFSDARLAGTVTGATTIIYGITFDLVLQPGVVVPGED